MSPAPVGPASLRPLEARDEARVRGWLEAHLSQHRAWWAAGYGQEGVAPMAELLEREWHDLEEASQSPQRTVAVLEQDGQATGIVLAGTRADRTMGIQIGVLQWIFVAPEGRGRGHADALMTHALAWMDARGVAGREVFVTALNAAAVSLYRRHGFEVGDYRMLARVNP